MHRPRDRFLLLATALLLGAAVLVLVQSLSWVGKPFPGFLLLDNHVVPSAGLTRWPATAGGAIYQKYRKGVSGQSLCWGALEKADIPPEGMPDEQEELLYLLGENLRSLKQSPHLEHYKKLDQEIILFDEPIDTFLMMHVTTFNEKPFKAIDQAEPEPPTESEDEKDEDEDKEEEKEKDPFLVGIKEILGNRVIDVRFTDALTDSPCRLLGQGAAAYSRMMRYMTEDYIPQAKIMELNTTHPIVVGLKKLFENDPESSLLRECCFQLLESQELAEGNLKDVNAMIARTTDFMKQLLEK